MAEPDLVDEELRFGVSCFSMGTAFSRSESGEKGEESIPIAKRWRQDGGRRILSEQAQYRSLRPALGKLAAAPKPDRGAKEGTRAWPATPEKGIQNSAMSEIANEPSEKGLILDYVTDEGVSFSSYEFHADTTYYLIGHLQVQGYDTDHRGTVLFESGTVIKYTNGVVLSLGGWVDVTGGGAILTAVDDHTVGEQVGSGTLSGTYAAIALQLKNFGYSGLSISDLQIRYADKGILVNSAEGSPDYYFSNTDFLDCTYGFYGLSGITVHASSVRMCGVGTPLTPNNSTVYPDGYESCPIISSMANQTINEDGVATVNFTVWDGLNTPSGTVSMEV